MYCYFYYAVNFLVTNRCVSFFSVYRVRTLATLQLVQEMRCEVVSAQSLAHLSDVKCLQIEGFVKYLQLSFIIILPDDTIQKMGTILIGSVEVCKHIKQIGRHLLSIILAHSMKHFYDINKLILADQIDSLNLGDCILVQGFSWNYGSNVQYPKHLVL